MIDSDNNHSEVDIILLLIIIISMFVPVIIIIVNFIILNAVRMFIIVAKIAIKMVIFRYCWLCDFHHC